MANELSPGALTILGLDNVANIAPADLPISTAQAVAFHNADVVSAFLGTALSTHTGSTSNPHATTKAQVGLGNVDNLSAAQLANTGSAVGDAIAAALASARKVSVAGGNTPVALSALFGDKVDARFFGIKLDGVTDDSLKLKELCDSLSGTGKTVYIPYGTLLMGGAAQVSLDFMGIEGCYGDDSGWPYGNRSSCIWITDKTKSPFLLGRDWYILGLNFYYPEQIEANAAARGGPTVFPATFVPNPALGGGVAHGRFEKNLVLNAFRLFDFGATTLGVIDISYNRMYCIDYCVRATTSGDLINFNTNFVSIGAFQTETFGQGTYVLSDYTNSKGRVFAIVGNGTPTSASTMGSIGGILGVNNFTYGYHRFISVEQGFLQLVDLYGTCIDGTATLLAVEPGGRVANVQFTGGLTFGYRYQHMYDDIDPLVSIINPAPSDDGSPGCEVNITGMMIGFHNSSMIDIFGRNVYRVNITNNRFVRFGVSGTASRTYYGARIMAPGANIQFNGNEVAPLVNAAKTVGVQVLAADRFQANGNAFTGVGTPIDIQTDRGRASLTGNTSALTNNPGSITAFGELNTASVTTGLPSGTNYSGRKLTTYSGTPRVGDAVRAGAFSAAFNNGTAIFASYTVKAGDTLQMIAAGVEKAVNSTAAMTGAGLFSQSYDATVEVYAPQSLNVQWVFDITSGSTTAHTDNDLSSTYGANVQEVGNTWDKPVAVVSSYNIDGGSIHMLSTTRMLRLLNGATVPGYTVFLPPAPVDGHQITINTLGAITNLTFSGGSIINAPTSAAANSSIGLTWYAPTSQWIRLQ